MSRILGIPRCHPNYVQVSPKISVSQQLAILLPTLIPDTPVLIQAGTGAGKTRAILDTLVPYALEHEQKVLFISSRAAISVQFKANLAHAIGQEDILTDYTPEGLRKLKKIGPVQILTFHSLWAKLNAHSVDLRSFDWLVWDEVHALALDGTFVPYTGELLRRVIRSSAGVRRIYLSATPEPILDKLAQWEGFPALTIYRWKSRYDQFVLHFYNNLDDLAKYFKVIPHEEHALIFVSSIREGKALLKMLPDSRLLTSESRADDPSEWQRLLTTQTLPVRVTIATTTLDAGVSLTDPALKHIVCESLNFAQIIQESGRKRLKSGENLNLYLKSPTRQQLGNRLKHTKETVANLALCEENPAAFVQRFILGNEQPELRGMCCSNELLGMAWDKITQGFYGNLTNFIKFSVNPLAVDRLMQQAALYSRLLAKKDDRPFEKHICKLFGQQVPQDPSCWLDGSHVTSNDHSFLQWLAEEVNQSMGTESERTKFATDFRSKYEAVYGPRKGSRADRPTWGLSIIKKILAELNLGYKMESDRGVWYLVDTRIVP